MLTRLGAGGMGVVYVGEHELLGNRVAIKVINPELTRDEAVVARFLNEAVAAARIKHAGIVQIFDYGTDPASGSAYFVMELLEGHDLAHRIAHVGVLTPADAVRISLQIADTLRAAHAAGIVHRDLKPDNVFLVPDSLVPGGERVKLLDFGIAKLFGDGRAQSTTKTGDVLGTPYYMSPEQCHGAGAVDHRTDIYSLGCVLFQLVCGRVPFPGTGVGQVIGAHLHVPPPAPRSLRPELPAPLEELILQMLAKPVDERLQSMTAVIGALTAVAEECQLQAATPSISLHGRPGQPAMSPGVGLAPTLATAGTQASSGASGIDATALALASTAASGHDIAPHAPTAYASGSPSERAATQIGVDTPTLHGAAPRSGPRTPVVVLAVACVAIVMIAAVAFLFAGAEVTVEEGPEPAISLSSPGVAVAIEEVSPVPVPTLEAEEPLVAPELRSLDDLPELKGVPAFALKPVGEKQAKRGRKHFNEGDKLREALDYPGAIAEYIEGLRDDPGNIATRYNLACSYVLSGEPGKGLALLHQFKEAGCNFCKERLVRARDDNDWRALFGHPVFEQLTTGVTVEAMGFEAAARGLADALTDSGDPSEVMSLFHPRRAVTVYIEHLGCDPEGEDKCEERFQLRGTGVIARWVRDTYEDHEHRDPQVVVGRLIECHEDDPESEDFGCCEFDSHGGQRNALFIDRVCFAVTSGAAPYWKSISARDEL